MQVFDRMVIGTQKLLYFCTNAGKLRHQKHDFLPIGDTPFSHLSMLLRKTLPKPADTDFSTAICVMRLKRRA